MEHDGEVVADRVDGIFQVAGFAPFACGVHRRDEDVEAAHAAVTVGGKVKGGVVSQEREHLVAGRVDAFAEVEGMLEWLAGVFAHGHPDVVAAEAAFAFGSEIHDELVAREGGVTDDIQGVDAGNLNGTCI